MVVVLGGGISGLAAAHYLLRRGVNNIQLIETTSRVGGWIQTHRNVEESFLFEEGPRTIRPVGPAGTNTLNLIERLGLKDEVVPILKTHNAAKQRFLYVNKTLNALPNSFGSLFRTSAPFTKPLVAALWHDYKHPAPRTQQTDDSIYNFVERRFGKEIAEYAVSAMICGICAGNAKDISVKFLMKNLYELEQAHGGVVRGIMGKAFKKNAPVRQFVAPSMLAQRSRSEKWAIYSIRGGLQTLIEAMHQQLCEDAVPIQCDTTCEQIEFSNGKAKLHLKSGSSSNIVETNRVVSSVPSPKLASMVNRSHPQLSELLSQTPFVDVAVVNLQFRGKATLKESGFGLLVPPCEGLPILGVIFDSCCFDMGDNTVITVMLGGHWFRKYFGEQPNESEFLATSRKYLREILQIDREPDTFRVNVLRNCIPQYTVGHYERVDAMRQYISQNRLPLHLCGASYDGVGVNDVIMSAFNTVEQIDV